MDEQKPAAAADVAGLLKQSAAERRSVVTGGAFTKDRMGGAIAESALRISTAGLNRILQYEPKDLTISAEAGVPYAELTSLLAMAQTGLKELSAIQTAFLTKQLLQR